MIGVIANKSERKIVEEFFELFKTPWEFYKDTRDYDVVLSTQDNVHELNAKLIILYNSNAIEFDQINKVVVRSQKRKGLLKYHEKHIPIYGNMLTFDSINSLLLKISGAAESVAIETKRKNTKILRIGFDLFHEIFFLLSIGQPKEYAHIPTLEIHISILRDLILRSGISLIEIPPVPAGYNFISCLTHDVDFVGIRRHRFDHTMLGFIYRASIGTLINFLKRKITWDKLLKNWKAVLFLPFVYLGILKDYWIQFNHYLQIEKGIPSTFFIIPFKNQVGHGVHGKANKRRATKYDITDIKSEVEKLLEHGCEVGLHGIDAWCDADRGREELNRIAETVGTSDIGTRIHWLCLNRHSFQNLEKAGFYYDSTFGYNDSVGYRGGTTQTFRPIGTKKLLELPLHIQDTALFYPDRMNLSESKATNLIDKLIENSVVYGGVLTINWHHRSLAPERLWGDFYSNLLGSLKEKKVWFGTAYQITKWFERRRSVSFDEICLTKKSLKIKLTSNNDKTGPDLMLRIHEPENLSAQDVPVRVDMQKHFDIALSEKMDIKGSL